MEKLCSDFRKYQTRATGKHEEKKKKKKQEKKKEECKDKEELKGSRI